jgi:hypothetical protein
LPITIRWSRVFASESARWSISSALSRASSGGARREALAETNYDPNRLIDALFDPDGLGCGRASAEETAVAHVAALGEMAALEHDGALVAAAAVMLAVSLGYAPGYAPGEVTAPRA